MSYKVIHFFTDLQDFNHPYKVGDTFPRQGMKASEARLKELSGYDNKQGKPLIVMVGDSKQEVEPIVEKVVENEYTKTEINRMSTSDLQELATKEGIDGAEDMTGSELKKLLIEKFGL